MDWTHKANVRKLIKMLGLFLSHCKTQSCNSVAVIRTIYPHLINLRVFQYGWRFEH